MKFKDKVVIVTGAGRGIGKEVALQFADEGASVVLVGRKIQSLQEVEHLIKGKNQRAISVAADVTQKSQVTDMVARTLDEYGGLDILVNNAGTDIKGEIATLEESVWDHIISLNLKGVFLCTQAVVPHMTEKKFGRIINMASMAGRTGEPFTSAYCSSKFGVIGFTQAVALEVGRFGITINAVCPGPVETELIYQSVEQSAKIKGISSEQFMQDFFIGPTPLGRIASTNDVAKATLFLASDDAEFITGVALNVSGGREMH